MLSPWGVITQWGAPHTVGDMVNIAGTHTHRHTQAHIHIHTIQTHKHIHTHTIQICIPAGTQTDTHTPTYTDTNNDPKTHKHTQTYTIHAHGEYWQDFFQKIYEWQNGAKNKSVSNSVTERIILIINFQLMPDHNISGNIYEVLFKCIWHSK